MDCIQAVNNQSLAVLVNPETYLFKSHIWHSNFEADAKQLPKVQIVGAIWQLLATLYGSESDTSTPFYPFTAHDTHASLRRYHGHAPIDGQ
jgi:hypothetical protein